MELRGRRGWALPVIAAGLLLPVAGIGMGGRAPPAPKPPPAIVISGEVPPEVASLPQVQAKDKGGLAFRKDQGTVLVRGPGVPPAVREALDGDQPTLRLEVKQRPLRLPGRTLILALISASILTTAISGSLAGERSRRTLETLLASSATRGEIITGKWLAWSSFGAMQAVLASLIAIAAGNVAAGPWLIPLAVVPGAAVAVGLYLVRRAADLVGGTTVTMRVLPAVLAITGILAWVLGRTDPMYGALVPLGGALIAAGNTWDGWGPPLLATVVSGGCTAGLLWLTTRDLERPSLRQAGPKPLASALWALVIGIAAWWTPVLGPTVWAAAGNPTLADQLSRPAAAIAGSAGLLVFCVLAAGRSPDPRRTVGMVRPDAPGWRVAAATALAILALPVSGLVTGWTPVPADPLLDGARQQLAGALQPATAGIGVVTITIVAQELFWRGWLYRRSGAVFAVLAFTVVHSPLDPLRGLFLGVVLVALTAVAGGSVVPAILARLGWAGIVLVAPSMTAG